MKIGDLVTGYYKGWWRITDVVDRSTWPGPSRSDSPLVHMELVMDSSFRKPKKNARTRRCDGSYIRVWDGTDLQEELQKRLDKIRESVTILEDGFDELQQEVR